MNNKQVSVIPYIRVPHNQNHKIPKLLEDLENLTVSIFEENCLDSFEFDCEDKSLVNALEKIYEVSNG